MIVLPRCLARRFRAVLRRCAPHGPPPPVLLRATAESLALESVPGDAALRLEHPGRQVPGLLALRADVLARFEAATDDPVTLEGAGPGEGRASWYAGGSPRAAAFATLDPAVLTPFPDAPAKLATLPAAFLGAMADAARVAAREPTRYALQRVLLRGRTGEVVATDGKQLLVQAGFPFPWKDDALVPRLDVWGSRELPREGPVSAGRTDTHVLVRAGPWAFALEVGRGARYPPFEGVLPRPGTAAGTLRLAREDLAALARELPGLGGPAARQAPVTLDLGPPSPCAPGARPPGRPTSWCWRGRRGRGRRRGWRSTAATFSRPRGWASPRPSCTSPTSPWCSARPPASTS